MPPRREPGHWIDRLFALGLVLCGLPVFLAVSAAILIAAGRPVFYGGERLGRDKRPFRMFKFRTLVDGAEQITGSKVIESPGRMAIPLGKFLRETRVDELPQLFNILRGEMAFVGPRPVRPLVYETVCRDIPDYDRRFLVRPGLIGVSQLFTPSSTSKRYRVLLDNRWLSRAHAPGGVLIVLFTIWHVVRTALRRVARWVRLRVDTRILGRYSRKRMRRRVELGSVDSGEPGWVVADIDGKAFRIHSRERIEELPRTVELVLALAGRESGLRVRRTVCRVRAFSRRQSNGGHDTIVAYRPVSARSHYMLYQYYLCESFAFKPKALRASVAAISRRKPALSSPTPAHSRNGQQTPLREVTLQAPDFDRV